MLRSPVKAVSPEVEQVVNEIICDESRTELRERRDAARKPISRAAKVHVGGRGAKRTVDAVTRDLSCLGVGLITCEAIEPGAVAEVEIARDGRNRQGNIRLMAECRWSDQIDDRWFLSGWNFISLR